MAKGSQCEFAKWGPYALELSTSAALFGVCNITCRVVSPRWLGLDEARNEVGLKI